MPTCGRAVRACADLALRPDERRRQVDTPGDQRNHGHDDARCFARRLLLPAPGPPPERIDATGDARRPRELARPRGVSPASRRAGSRAGLAGPQEVAGRPGRVLRVSSHRSTAALAISGPWAVTMTGAGKPATFVNARARCRETPAISAISA